MEVKSGLVRCPAVSWAKSRVVLETRPEKLDGPGRPEASGRARHHSILISTQTFAREGQAPPAHRRATSWSRCARGRSCCQASESVVIGPIVDPPHRPTQGESDIPF